MISSSHIAVLHVAHKVAKHQQLSQLLPLLHLELPEHGADKPTRRRRVADLSVENDLAIFTAVDCRNESGSYYGHGYCTNDNHVFSPNL